MNLKYIFLGILQGVTEPIPVSSSGHLRLFREIFNTTIFDDLNFEIIVNFGSFLAILFIFRKEVITLIKNFFKFIFNKKERKITKNDFKYCLLIAIGSIPVGIVGFLLKDYIEKWLGNIKIIGIAFFITFLSLMIVKKIKGTKDDKDITYKDAILIGLMQMFAVIPGISRSGITLVGCLLRDLKRESALKYTFMLYFPVSIATFGLSIMDIIKNNQLNTIWLPYLLGLIASTIATYFASQWFFKLVKKGKLSIFAYYCLALCIITLLFL